jgi:hypothetical protein
MNNRCEKILSQYLYQQQSRIMNELRNLKERGIQEFRI